MEPSGRIRTTVVVVLALLVAGCGSSSDGGGKDRKLTRKQAREAFVDTCGSCHTLKDAGTHGTFGPNLDELRPDREAIRQQVRDGGGGMPEGLLEGHAAEDVSAYVASAAGK